MLPCNQGGQAEPCFPPHPTRYQKLRFTPLFEFTQNLGLTRKGYWRIANSHILKVPLTNEYLAALGYDDISKRYEALHSSY
jgi:hypothetical protein